MRVFFYQRPSHRKRQRETVDYCTSQIEVVTPENINFINDIVLSNRHKNKKLNLKSKISKLIPLNAHRISDTKKADYVYTWGCIPIGIKTPYIIEMDNPYCICYYNLFWFKCFRPLWKKILLSSRLKKIVCISNACKKSIVREFGGKIEKKIQVVYPYIQPNYEKNIKKKEDIVEFLFVSTQFCLKGGRETIEAINILYKEGLNVHLTLVTCLKEIDEKYRNLKFIDYLEANIDKKILHNKYFTKADIFILPTFQDSFGMVFLEALSFGIPIIASNMYAVPEMVENGKTGILVDLPLEYYEKDYRINPKYYKGNILDDILAVSYFEDTVKQLVVAAKKVLDLDTRNYMKKNSIALYEKNFSVKKRNESFANIFND